MKQNEKKTKQVVAGVKKMVQSKFHFEQNPTKLRETRIAERLSQDDMADKLDYAHTTYGEIERGRRPVRRETAERIATILRADVTGLFSSHASGSKGKKLLAKRA